MNANQIQDEVNRMLLRRGDIDTLLDDLNAEKASLLQDLARARAALRSATEAEKQQAAAAPAAE